MPSLRILLLEDDARDAELVRGLLEADQFVCEVTCVQTRPEFLTALENKDLDLVLADYKLPSFDGISALKLASSARPDLPFIFVSGTLGEELAIEALKLGATDYVLKTGLSRLAPSVRRALREAAERAERKKAEEALRRNEAYLAEAQRLSRTGSFGWNVSSGEVYWSNETYRIFECDTTTKPTVEMIADRTHPDDRMRLRQIVDRAVIEGSGFTAEYRLMMPSSSVKYVRLVARQTASDDQVAFAGAITDITEHKRAEQRQAAQYGVSRILADSDSLGDAATDLLRTICEAMDLDWGALWSVDQRAQRLRSDCIWHPSKLDSGELDKASREIAWSPGQGRVGEAWQSGKPLWIADVAKDPGFRRAPGAARAGLRTYLACPILLGREALGVIEFFSRTIRQPEEQELAMLAAIGSQTGQFIQRKQAEQAVQASEKRFRAIIEHAYDVVMLLDAEATVLYASPSVETVLGYRPEELIGQDGHELIHPGHRGDAATQFTRSAEQPGSVIPGERLLLHKDGSSRRVESVFVNLLSEPSVQAVVAHLRDVSERKQAEEALRASEERFRTLMEFSFDVYWETDARHRFIRQEFSERLSDAPPPGSEIGKTRWEVPYLEPDEEAWREHRETLDAHLSFRDFELARPNPDGGKRYVSVSGLPVFDKAGSFIGYHGVGRHITERKQIEEALRQRERELREVVETIPAMATMTLLDGSVAFTSRRWTEYTGLTAGETEGSGWQAAVHPDDLDRHMRTQRESLATGEPFESETRFRAKNGDYRWFLVRAVPLRDEVGNVLRWYAILADIEDRKRAEAALHESEEQWKAVFENNPTMYFMVDETDVILSVNPFGAEHLGYAIGELIGRPVEILIHESDREPALRNKALCRERLGRTLSWELRKIGKDGEILWARETARAMLIKNRPVVLVVSEDISEAKRAEYFFAQVFHSSPDGISIVGKDYRYQRVNPIYERNWDMPAERIVGKHVAGLLGVAVFEQTVKPYLDRCFEGEEVRFADWFTNSVGRSYLAVTYSPLRPRSEQVDAALVITRDLTDHLRASEALRETQTQLAHANRVATTGQLTASIAHEVNQPIAATVTNAQAGLRWLGAEPPNLDEVRQAFGRIVRDGSRAGAVVGRIRELIKGAPPRAERLDINAAIREVIEVTRSEAMKNSVSVQTKFVESLPLVRGDRVELQQVILNLILNAIEAMSETSQGSRELLIATGKTESGDALVAVRDSGPGLAPAALQRLFEAFYTTKPSGLGLGLSICRSIIEAHGGRLWASANAPRGAVFHFTLPVDSDIASRQ